MAIHHLIAGYRKQDAFLGCLLVALIFFDDGEGYIKQWNVGRLHCTIRSPVRGRSPDGLVEIE